MEGMVGKLQGWTAVFGMKILTAILIVVVGRWVARFIRNTTEKMMIRSKVDATLVSFVGNLITYPCSHLSSWRRSRNWGFKRHRSSP